MIDDGELDWKVLAIDVRDPLAEMLKDIEDVDTHCPGVVSGTTFCVAFSFNISPPCFLSKLTNMGVILLQLFFFFRSYYYLTNVNILRRNSRVVSLVQNS
jgi:hypothetical protein